MSRKFLTPKDEYAVSRTVKAFEVLTVLQTQALNIYGHNYLEFVKEPCPAKTALLKRHGNIIVGRGIFGSVDRMRQSAVTSSLLP